MSDNQLPIVACQGLTKVFKDFWLRSRAKAVIDLNIEIYPKEVFGLLGPNGSGKSTTIKMILGLLRPTKGRIAVFGKQPSDVHIKHRIGYLPEESYLYPFLNARETLDYYGKLFELDHRTRKKRIDELLDMVGLTAAQFRHIREYSKGMQRRIGLAQALINDPELLILDEPTTGLDPLGSRQVKDLIIQLGQRGKTVLLSSHLLADVEDCVDRMVILYGGRIRAEGDQDSLLENQERTSIETDALDQDTIAAIDRLVRERSAGTKQVIKVFQPRQKLEELFLDIVEKAQTEQLQTAGATHGGETASFLTASNTEGDALISQLTAAEPMAFDVEPAEVDSSGPDSPDSSQSADDVIGSLLADDDAPDSIPEPQPTPQSPSTKTPTTTKPKIQSTQDLDLGMIDSLIDDSESDSLPSTGPTDEDRS